MKFTKQGSQYSLEFTPREAECFKRIAALFPLIPAEYRRVQRTVAGSTAEAQKLLEESVLARNAELKRTLNAWLERMKTVSGERNRLLLPLQLNEIEAFLQFLNDLRVGSWVQLGSPDDERQRQLRLSPQTASFILAMDFCALLQLQILEVLDGSA